MENYLSWQVRFHSSWSRNSRVHCCCRSSCIIIDELIIGADYQHFFIEAEHKRHKFQETYQWGKWQDQNIEFAGCKNFSNVWHEFVYFTGVLCHQVDWWLMRSTWRGNDRAKQRFLWTRTSCHSCAVPLEHCLGKQHRLDPTSRPMSACCCQKCQKRQSRRSWRQQAD